MRLLTYTLLIVISFALQSCFLATTRKTIDESPEVVKDAILKVAKKTDMTAVEGPIDATVYATLSGIPIKSKYVEAADFVIMKRGTNPLNNTATYGAVKLTPLNSGTFTGYTGVFSTESGDPKANGNLIIELARQQILLDKGLQQQYKNEFKSRRAFVARNFISPFWGANYLLKDNPLIAPSSGKYLYLQNGFGDVLMTGMLAGAAFTKNDRDKKGLIVTGIITGLAWRFLCLLNLTDIDDYNVLAKTDYNLKIIKAE
jgi:hypothetical protein